MSVVARMLDRAHILGAATRVAAALPMPEATQNVRLAQLSAT